MKIIEDKRKRLNNSSSPYYSPTTSPNSQKLNNNEELKNSKNYKEEKSNKTSFKAFISTNRGTHSNFSSNAGNSTPTISSHGSEASPSIYSCNSCKSATCNARHRSPPNSYIEDINFINSSVHRQNYNIKRTESGILLNELPKEEEEAKAMEIDDDDEFKEEFLRVKEGNLNKLRKHLKDFETTNMTNPDFATFQMAQDIVYHIYSYLNLEDFKQVRLVGNVLKGFADERFLFQHIDFQLLFPNEEDYNAMNSDDEGSDLVLKPSDEEDSTPLLQSTNGTSDMVKNIYLSMVKSFPDVQAITIPYGPMPFFINHLPQYIEKMVVLDCSELTKTHIELLPSTLKHLRLIGFDCLEDVKFPPSLLSLTLNICTVTSGSMDYIADTNNNLKSLQMHGCTVNPHGLNRFPKSLTRILILGEVTEPLKWLSKVPRAVTTIACEITSGTDKAWSLFTGLNYLKKLEIHGTCDIGDALKYLPNSITNLKLLDCSGYSQISFPKQLEALNISFIDEARSSCLKNLPQNLQKLALCSCFVDNDIIKNLPASLKNLTLIDGSHINDQSINYLPKNLNALSLKNCGLSNEAIPRLNANLHTLTLGEELVNVAGLENLPKGLKKLRLDSDSYPDKSVFNQITKENSVEISWT